MKVLKFGGSSLGTPERIRGVKEIIKVQPLPCIVVVSAFEGVTDNLLRIAELASRGNSDYKAEFEKLVNNHREFAKALLSDPDDLNNASGRIEVISNELGEIFRGFFLLRESTKHALDQALAVGERISSLIISLFLDGQY